MTQSKGADNTFSLYNFFQKWGGGGAEATPAPPPIRALLIAEKIHL